MEKVKDKIIGIFKWIKEECKDWRTLFIFMIIVIIVYSPTWVGLLLYKLFNWKWGMAIATTSFIFWMGPFTPFFPLCIAMTFAIKGLMRKNDTNTK